MEINTLKNNWVKNFYAIYGSKEIELFLKKINFIELTNFTNNHELFCEKIEEFIKKNKLYKKETIYDYDNEFKDIENLIRDPRVDFSGWENKQNTCYFNSLIQSLYYIPNFFEEISQYDCEMANGKLNRKEKDYLIKFNSVELIYQLRILFARMLLGEKKIYETQNVFNKIVDDKGNKIKIGDFKDFMEFGYLLFDRINLAFSLSNKSLLSSILNKPKNNFFGSLVIESKGNSTKSDFGPIILNIHNNDLIKSLKNYFSNGEYIDNSPNFLFIQMNRVKYDENNKLIKNNDIIKVEEYIYLDRFLYKNKNKVWEMDKKQKNKISELNILKNELNKLEKYGSTQSNSLNILEDTLSLIDDINLKVFKEIDKNNETKNAIDINIVSFISVFKNNLSLEIEHLKIRINKLKDDIDEIGKDLNKLKYNLHGIIIHSGSISSGHYYCYIKINDIWIKFNDSKVEYVDKDLVIKDCEGKIIKNNNAYCFIYIDDKYSKQFNIDYYKSIIQPKMIEIVNTNNFELRINLYLDKFFISEQNRNINPFKKHFISTVNTNKKDLSKNKLFKNYFYPKIYTLDNFLIDFLEYSPNYEKVIYSLLRSKYYNTIYKDILDELNIKDIKIKEEVYKIKLKKRNIKDYAGELKFNSVYQTLYNSYSNQCLKLIYLFEGIQSMNDNKFIHAIDCLKKSYYYSIDNIKVDLCIKFIYEIIKMVIIVFILKLFVNLNEKTDFNIKNIKILELYLDFLLVLLNNFEEYFN